MSAIIERIAQSGQDMADRIERAGAAADSAFGNMSARAAAVARTIDGVATSIDQTEEAQTDLTAAMERASQTMEELAENDNVSAEAKEELARASEEAEEAMNALTAAQERAQQAMDEYDQLLASGCDNLDELEEAAQNAADAARELDEQTGRPQTLQTSYPMRPTGRRTRQRRAARGAKRRPSNLRMRLLPQG